MIIIKGWHHIDASIRVYTNAFDGMEEREIARWPREHTHNIFNE